jgi:hypothetical protein
MKARAGFRPFHARFGANMAQVSRLHQHNLTSHSGTIPRRTFTEEFTEPFEETFDDPDFGLFQAGHTKIELRKILFFWRRKSFSLVRSSLQGF